MLLVLFLMPIAGQAQEEKMQVSVVVSGDETIKPHVMRYIRNALRNIKDVAIVDKSYTYQLHIVSLKVTEDVYSLSLFVLSKVSVKEVFKGSILSLYHKISDKLNDELGYYRDESKTSAYKVINIITDAINADTSLEEEYDKYGLHVPIIHVVLIDHSLQDLCKRAVAHFNTAVLEAKRNETKILNTIRRNTK